jgi:hypothetical protein
MKTKVLTIALLLFCSLFSFSQVIESGGVSDKEDVEKAEPKEEPKEKPKEEEETNEKDIKKLENDIVVLLKEIEFDKSLIEQLKKIDAEVNNEEIEKRKKNIEITGTEIAGKENKIKKLDLEDQKKLVEKLKEELKENESTISKFFDKKTKLYLEANIDLASSSEDTRSDSQAGTGTLGIKFERNFIYGKVRFTVFSKNDEIKSENDNDIKIFGSNLLIPSNSSNKISNFNFLLGVKSFYDFDKVENNVKFLSRKRIGGFVQFSMHNTTWIKGETNMPITINSLDLNITYRLLSLKIEGKDNGRADLYLMTGYANRRLGGDYGLDSNTVLRKDFINTDELGFDGTNYGARLEINNFFGQVNVTYFGQDDIPGFSGNQATVTIGFNASLNLTASESKDK